MFFLGSCRRSNNKNIEVDLCPRHPHQHPLQVKGFYRTCNVLRIGAFSCAFFIGRKGKDKHCRLYNILYFRWRRTRRDHQSFQTQWCQVSLKLMVFNLYHIRDRGMPLLAWLTFAKLMAEKERPKV